MYVFDVSEDIVSMDSKLIKMKKLI